MITLSVILLSLAVSCTSDTEKSIEKAKVINKTDSVSYIIGLDYGQGVKEQDIEINPLMVYKGFQDALKGKSLFSDSIRELIINDFNVFLKSREEEKTLKEVEKNISDGAAFLNANRNAPGVVELPGGLQYKILKEGAGRRPSADDSVRIHYRAMFTDRVTFDMSYDRGPAGIRLGSVIPGLAQGIVLMKEGSIFELYIPPELGYGNQNFANIIPGGSTLIYAVELFEIIE
ncbi:MAG: FKBP-type peptidyl-prolyl cis-trans isomerase [Bacteroidales bacterium]|nr:FKBP-type peptidyl-prolyl cis-trans isomerase [Bacteroidales bacterium]